MISTPATVNGLAVFGNQNGEVTAVRMDNGKKVSTYKTGGPVYSSPAVAGGKIITGSADGSVYCLNEGGKNNGH